MLLNLSHEITNCGLPKHLQDRYVRYKQGNRAIVGWMTRYGPDRYRGKKTLPIKHMICLGNILCNKVSELGVLPADVDFYFREVIRERAHLSQHYRKHRDKCERDDLETINHEHFTQSLKEIHDVLLTAGKVGPKLKPKKAQSRDTSFYPTLPSSPGHGLAQPGLVASDDSHETSDLDSNDEVNEYADTDATSDCSHEHPRSHTCECDIDNEAEDFLDSRGALGSAVEAFMLLETITKLADAVGKCWAQAGAGGTSMAASAVYTNTLISKAVQHIRYFQLEETVSPLQLRERAREMLTVDDDHSIDHILTLLETVARAFNGRFLQSQAGTQPECIESMCLVETLITDIVEVLAVAGTPKIVFESIPGIEIFKNLMLPRRYAENLLPACAILVLVVSSHTAYSLTLPNPKLLLMTRITSLRMAQEGLSALAELTMDTSIFPCKCTNTLSYRVCQVEAGLTSFAKHKSRSALMTSPLITNSQMLEVQDLCCYYGMHLFHYRHYCAAIIHIYNALVSLRTVESNAAMDEILDLFCPVLWSSGGRPQSGFVAQWMRYTGARLNFKKGKKQQNHQDTWCMAIPARTAARSAGLNIEARGQTEVMQVRYDYGSLCSTVKLKQNGWCLEADIDSRLERQLGIPTTDGSMKTRSAIAGTTNTTPSQRIKHNRNRSCTNDIEGNSVDCDNLLHNIASSFAPIADHIILSSRFNHLAFFRSMTRIVSKISDATHAVPPPTSSSTQQSSPSKSASGPQFLSAAEALLQPDSTSTPKSSGLGEMCLCFTQTLLRGADRIQEARKRHGLDARGATWTKVEKECIACFNDNLLKELKAAGVENGKGGKWIWESLK